MSPVKVSTFLKLHRRENWKIKMNDIKKEVRSKRKGLPPCLLSTLSNWHHKYHILLPINGD